MTSEAQLQRTWISLFNFLYPDCLVSLSLNGITLPGSPKVKAQIINQAKADGMVNGIPDILVYLPNAISLHLEWKHPNGKGVQSEDQKDIEHILVSLGHTYYLVNDLMTGFQLVADHTELHYRQERFQQLTDSLPSTLAEPFLYFPIGTPRDDVLTAVEPYFYL